VIGVDAGIGLPNRIARRCLRLYGAPVAGSTPPFGSVIAAADDAPADGTDEADEDGIGGEESVDVENLLRHHDDHGSAKDATPFDIEATVA
jgi:hypothetical protein